PPPSTPLFPYTTLFRSDRADDLSRCERLRAYELVARASQGSHLDRSAQTDRRGKSVRRAAHRLPRSLAAGAQRDRVDQPPHCRRDRKSTRLNSSHVATS